MSIANFIYSKIFHNKIKGPIFLNENKENNNLFQLKELLNKVGDDQKKIVEEEIRKVEAGDFGENAVIYELNHLDIPALILHDITIDYLDGDSQIDFIIITNHCIIILETKNLQGDISIDEEGNFIRFFKTYDGKVFKKESIYSPISQNEKHVNAIKKILIGYKFIKYTPIKSLVTIANDKTIVDKRKAPREIKEQVITRDLLIDRIEKIVNMNEDKVDLKDKTMYEIAEFLLKQNKTRVYDYIEKLHLKVNIETVLINETNFNNESDDSAINEDNSVITDELYENLRKYRYLKANELKIKPYFIFSNDQLSNLITQLPRTKEELLKVKGFADKKVKLYGDDILRIINEYIDKKK